MISFIDIEKEIVAQASAICTQQPAQLLFESQLSYWFSVKSFVKEGGYSLVKKRMPGVSEPLAQQIAEASSHQLIAISHNGFCR